VPLAFTRTADQYSLPEVRSWTGAWLGLLYERMAHRRALRPHLLQRGLAYPPGEVVADGEHDHEQQVGHRGYDLGEGYDVPRPYIIRGRNRTQPPHEGSGTRSET
jgi:hypothetical protein